MHFTGSPNAGPFYATQERTQSSILIPAKLWMNICLYLPLSKSLFTFREPASPSLVNLCQEQTVGKRVLEACVTRVQPCHHLR